MMDIPVTATGLLATFVEAGYLNLADFHVARRICAMLHEPSEPVELAVALTVRQLTQGSVCLDLEQAHLLAPLDVDDDGQLEAMPLPWPEQRSWQLALLESPLTALPGQPSAPLRLWDSRLYLERYFREERSIAESLAARRELPPRSASDEALARGTNPRHGISPDPAQAHAIRLAATCPTTVITGGPGTGKTTTVARILDAIAVDQPDPFVALAAPTGKAASRLTTAVMEELTATANVAGSLTVHSLLGAVPNSNNRTYHRDNPLPYDIVVVDESSMLSQSMMAWLLDAVGPQTQLILLGDPHQLASVEEGAVLAHIVEAGLMDVAELTTNWRSNEEITATAQAIKAGDTAVGELLGGAVSLVEWDPAVPVREVDPLRNTATRVAQESFDTAASGDVNAALKTLHRHRLLCAHREGPFGVAHWAQGLRGLLSLAVPGYDAHASAWPGAPLLITRNSDFLSNGDVGIVVRQDDRLLAAIEQPTGTRLLPPSSLDSAADMHAMTVHKSQGSQFDTVSFVLPPLTSPLLTRELLYTAVTRARDEVVLYGTREQLAAAVATPTRRHSGLGHYCSTFAKADAT